MRWGVKLGLGASCSSTFFCCGLFQKANDLSKRQKTFIGGQQTIVEKEISKVQNRVIMETVSRVSVTLRPGLPSY